MPGAGRLLKHTTRSVNARGTLSCIVMRHAAAADAECGSDNFQSSQTARDIESSAISITNPGHAFL